MSNFVLLFIFIGPHKNKKQKQKKQKTKNKKTRKQKNGSARASVRAGLLAMQAEGVTHALVAYVSGGIYAGEYMAKIRLEFERLVSDVASAIGYDATIVIVDRRS